MQMGMLSIHFNSNMAKAIIHILGTLFIILSAQLCAQGSALYRYDTVQIEQQWKKYLTGERDTSYLKVCSPNNDVKPMNDCNYDRFVIICDDDAIIRLNTMPVFPSTIEPYIIKDYGDTITKSFGNAYLGVLQKEYFNRYISGFPKDSSLYKPEPIVLEGVDKNGMCWKLIRIEYVCISYENVSHERKGFYDSVLNEYKLLSKTGVSSYRHLPLYK